MAKKKDSTGLIIGLGLMGLAFYALMQRQRFTPNPAFPNYPAEPVQGTADWFQWVNAIIQLSNGITQQLFGPGGPFEHYQLWQIENAIDEEAGSDVYCYDPITGAQIPC